MIKMVESEYRYTHLKERGFIRIYGADAVRFLNGLVTNQIERVSPSCSLYGCMLTPQGRFHFDFFIAQWRDGLLLECARESVTECVATLRKYRLRAKVEIEDYSDTMVAYAVPEIALEQLASSYADPTLQGLGFTVPLLDESLLIQDPRYMGMGARIWMPATPGTSLDLLGGVEMPEEYTRTRIAFAVPEGMTDMLPNKSFPQEFGLDALHAIDYDKGCYLGQELTARTHYRGTVRKKIYHVQAQEGHILLPGTEILLNETVVGSLYSCYKHEAIALLKCELLTASESPEWQCSTDGVPVTVSVPPWRVNS